MCIGAEKVSKGVMYVLLSITFSSSTLKIHVKIFIIIYKNIWFESSSWVKLYKDGIFATTML